jgi:hypothetical protein
LTFLPFIIKVFSWKGYLATLFVEHYYFFVVSLQDFNNILGIILLDDSIKGSLELKLRSHISYPPQGLGNLSKWSYELAG